MNSRTRSRSSATRSDGVKSTSGRLPATRPLRRRDGRALVLVGGAGGDVAPDDGPGNRGDRGGRPRAGQGPVRGDEGRVALPPPNVGGRDVRVDELGEGALRRGGARRVPALGDGALLEAERARDRQARPQGDRAPAGRDLARTFR